MVTKKIQDTIGLEEPVDVSVYVGKILSDQSKPSPSPEETKRDKSDPNIPFQGYRA